MRLLGVCSHCERRYGYWVPPTVTVRPIPCHWPMCDGVIGGFVEVTNVRSIMGHYKRVSGHQPKKRRKGTYNVKGHIRWLWPGEIIKANVRQRLKRELVDPRHGWDE
jgi:hypothetical protein